jgi:glycerol uptake facilitator
VRRNTYAAELFAEFLGTFTLIVFGVGVVALVVLRNHPGVVGDPAGSTFFGDFTTINWAWGFGVVMGVYVAGGISGAHINPAVTLALAVRRGFPWAKVAPYWIAQLLGAFVAALLIRWNFYEWFNLADPGHTAATQGVFSTSPGPGISVLGGFRSEVIGTMLLVMGVLAVTDARNTAPLSNLAPLMVGLLVVVIGMSLGALSGYAINPARDLGPRLASLLTGWGTAFKGAAGSGAEGDFYGWVPVVAPLIGGVIGAYVYDGFIGRFLPYSQPEVGETIEDSGTSAVEHPKTEGV